MAVVSPPRPAALPPGPDHRPGRPPRIGPLPRPWAAPRRSPAFPAGSGWRGLRRIHAAAASRVAAPATGRASDREAQMRKDVRRLVRDLVDQGFAVRRTRSGHVQVLRGGVVVAVLPGTPSDWRSLRNAVARLRRAGFVGG